MNRRYELIVTCGDDNVLNISATNDGFTGTEILGMLEMNMRDVYDQLRYPEKYTRTRVTKNEDGEFEKIEKKENE